jgi:hypothetical protein
MHVIDKRSLELVETLRPMPGKWPRTSNSPATAICAVERGKRRRVVIYDAATLKEAYACR